MNTLDEKYPEGHFIALWTGIGIAIGAGLGIPFGLILKIPAFFGIGLPIGLAIGSAIGSIIENKYKKEGKIRPLTAEEEKKKRLNIRMGIALCCFGILVLLLFMFI
jgi:hypothetical protein